MRALAAAQKAGVKVRDGVLAAAYHHLSAFTDQVDEPYALANFVLSTLDSGDEKLSGDAVTRLVSLAHQERGGLYWDLQANSPFYGWGTAGRYETTGLVVSALAAWRGTHPNSTDLDAPIRRGLVFLLRSRGAQGDWLSTQSTVRAMRAFADAAVVVGDLGGHGGAVEIRSNGRLVKSIVLPADPKATDPIFLNLSSFVIAGENRVELNGAATALVQLTSSYWVPWDQAKVRSSPELKLSVQFSGASVRAGEPVRCSVKAERVGFHGYGMMLAEIGLPPAADVDRASLESIVGSRALDVDHYEVLPDRLVLYLWPKAGGSSFDFFFTPRSAMLAKTAASLLYDYYNPEALTEVAPVRFSAGH